jgi:hypothetical protein
MNRFLAIAAALVFAAAASAQRGGGGGGGRGGAQGRGGRGATPQASAPFEMTGYWVSVVTEDWRYRMVTPPKGAFGGVPLNPAGRQAAMAWDPAKDEAAGEQCKSYGAAAIMRDPGRFHITWENDNTMKIEADSGTQTRLFHFGSAQPPAEASWQGYSTAVWDKGALRVSTTKLRAGYLRKNGVPYSANATLTEYYDRINAPNNDTWLVVTTVVDDPQYLTMPFVTSTHFKRLPDAAGWSPGPCEAK